MLKVYKRPREMEVYVCSMKNPAYKAWHWFSLASTGILVKRDRMLEAARSVRAGRMGQKDEGKQYPKGLSASTLSNRL